MARYMRTDLGRGHSKLVPPAVVGAGIAWHGPGVYLTSPASANQQNRRAAHSRLFAPTVVTQPVVEAFYGPDVRLTQPRRTGPFRSALRPPAVVHGARVNPGLRIKLTFGQRRPGRVLLRPPTVVTPEAVFIAEPVRATLAPSTRPKTQSQLLPPAVIGAGRVNPGLRIKLTFGSRGQAKSRLSPPAVVTAAVTDVFSGPPPTFAPQRRGRATYDLAAPIVIDSGAALGWLATSLAPQRRGQAKPFLGEPVVAPALVVVYYGPELTLVRRRTPPTTAFLRPPTILQTNVPTAVTLAPQRRGAPHSVLLPPRVVFLAVEIYGPEQSLARIRPVPTVSVLRPPVVVTAVMAEVFYGPQVNLTYSRRLVARSVLRPPVVIGAGRVNPGLRVKLTFGRRGVAKSRLFPPAGAVAVAAAGITQVNLTYSRRGETLSQLGRPAVIAEAEGPQGGVLVSLAPQRRGRPKSFLRPAVVVTPVAVVYYGPSVNLTYSSRRRGEALIRPPVVVRLAVEILGPEVTLARIKVPLSQAVLRKPAVVAAAPAFKPVVPPWLTYSRRGRPTYFLNPPTRVFPFFARKTEISLAPQSRGVPKSVLHLPQVVRLAVEIYGPETWLTYSRRGRPQYRLEPPAVVGKAPFRGIKTWLTRIKPRPTVALLKPPTVVRVPTAGLLQVHLTYSRRGRPVYFTTPFTPGKAPFRPIQVHLTRIKPAPTVSLIKPPAVVGAGIAFFGPSVTLVRIKHPPVQHNLRLTLVAFRRPGGDVCGFDIAGSFVCYLELPGAQVAGSERAGAQVSGSSRPGSIVTGSENAGSNVSGTDRKAT
jgi:hypothetical protein